MRLNSKLGPPVGKTHLSIVSFVSAKHPVKEEVGDILDSGFNPSEFLVVSWVVLIVCCGISLLVEIERIY